MPEESKQLMESVIKTETAERYTVFPIRHPVLWDFYKKQEATFWTAEEIRLTDDIPDWNDKLNENERYFIKNILAFFAGSDGIVNENLVINFYNEVQIPEARNFYAVQMMIEAIHSETYAILIDTYINDSEEKRRLFRAVDTIPAVKQKADWALKWIQEGSTLQTMIPEEYLAEFSKLETQLQKTSDSTSNKTLEALSFLTRQRPSFAQRLLAFICVEGIFFSGSFCAIYWLKSRGLMPGLSTANQFISRDENLHAEFAIVLYKMLENRLEEKVVHSIFKEAVEIEKQFITESLPVSLIGMNCKLMTEYIEYVADRWIVLLGYTKIYNTANPFPFMEMISVNTKENFFELNVSNYNKANVGSNNEDRELSFDCDDF